MASSSWSHLLEPTPIDPTGVVAVPCVPLASSSLHKIVDKGLLVAALSDSLESHSASFWSATPVNGISHRTQLSLGTVDDDMQSTAYEHRPDKISKSTSYLWCEDGIKELRKKNVAASLSPCDEYESHSLEPSLFSNDFLKRGSKTIQGVVRCCSPELTLQNWSSPVRLVAAPSENEVRNKNQQTSRPFRKHQSHQWYKRYRDMVAFREKYGHCLVPLNWPENPSLAHWVKRQRYQYRAKQENRRSTLTADRQEMLEKLGFVWDSHALGWEEQWHELREFKEKYGHCRVPKTNAANPQLAVWVKCQRRQFKLYCEGKDSNMTKPRIDKLDSLGFDFTPRKQESGFKITIFPPGYDHGGAGGGAGGYPGNFVNRME